MPWYHLPLKQLRQYRTSTQEPDGLDDWWARRIAAARALARPAVLTPHQSRLYDPIEVYDVEFSGGGHRWPAAHTERQLAHLRDHLPAA
jgi:cephalosporin-C deacetylase